MTHGRWKRLRSRCPKIANDVQNRLVSVANFKCIPTLERHMYSGTFASDILNYRAACVATLLTLYIESEWLDFFSFAGTRYRTLNRTLANLPGGIPFDLYYALRYTRLKRPITDRLELLTLLLYLRRSMEMFGFCPPENSAENVFMFATHDKIMRAIEYVNKNTMLDISHRSTYKLSIFVNFLADYNNIHNGDIVGLAKKSVKFHRQLKKDTSFSKDTLTALPKINLPDNGKITFISTVGGLNEEGASMRHCVSGYAGAAVNGACFIFHVEHEGKHATVEVSSHGYVSQSTGPMNQQNAASRYGEGLLGKWAKGLGNEKRVFTDEILF